MRLCPWSLALASSIPVLGLERFCPRKGCPWPWPWPRIFFVSLALALASSLVSSTPPLLAADVDYVPLVVPERGEGGSAPLPFYQERQGGSIQYTIRQYKLTTREKSTGATSRRVARIWKRGGGLF